METANNFKSGMSSKREDGFTLIEILVVILIIGILASIAIPVFLNQRQKANDASVQSDMRNTILVTKTYFTDNPELTTVNWGEVKKLSTKSSNVRITWTGLPGDFCIEGRHNNAKTYLNNWTYSSVTEEIKPGGQGSFSCSKVGGTHLIWE